MPIVGESIEDYLRSQARERLGGARRIALARELTKLHEEVVRGTAAELRDRFTEAPKGEVVLVVGPADGGEAIALTSGSNYHFEPAWSPDGMTLYFVGTREGEPTRNAIHAIRFTTASPNASRFASSQTWSFSTSCFQV
mgnify:CR=1 FL=1